MNTIAEALDRLTVEVPQIFEHLAMFPLVSRRDTTPGYVTLSEALAAGSARVTETSVGGSVPELLLDNGSDLRVLLLDGDELVGARQNRVLNVTILVGPRTRVAIPVSCVERGRWSYVSREFRTEDRMMFARARAAKMAQVSRSVRTSGERRSDQGAVWDAVAGKAAALRVDSPTEAMSDVYAHVDRSVGEYRAAFAAVPGQVGAVFAIDGRPVGLELFDAPSTLRSSLGRIVGSYALDAVESTRTAFQPPDRAAATEFVARAASASGATVRSVGLGDEVRLEAPGIVGEALVVDGAVVHLSALEPHGRDIGVDERGGPSLTRRRHWS